MAEIVNLRTVRKRKAKAAADEQAAQNRSKFGASKAEKNKLSAETAMAKDKLDGHKRTD